MSDLVLGSLWRRQQAEPEFRPAYLTALVRAGRLPLERLELAAHCHHMDARRALSWVDQPWPFVPWRARRRLERMRGKGNGDPPVARNLCREDDPLHRWCVGLYRFGSVVNIRAAWCAAMETLRRQGLDREDCTPERVLFALRQFIEAPCPERAEAVRRLIDATRDPEQPEDEAAWWERPEMLLAARRPEDHPGDQKLQDLWAFITALAIREAALFADFATRAWGDVVTDRAEYRSWHEGNADDRAALSMLHVVRRDMAAWALGGA